MKLKDMAGIKQPHVLNYDATAVIMYMPRCTGRYQFQLRARKNHQRPHTYYYTHKKIQQLLLQCGSLCPHQIGGVKPI